MMHDGKRFYNETFRYMFHADNKLHFKGCILSGCMFDNRLIVTFEDCTVEKCSIVHETQLRFVHSISYYEPLPAERAHHEKRERDIIAGICGHNTPDWSDKP